MNDTTKRVPTEQEIQEAEARLHEMKQAREEAKQTILSTLKSQEMLNSLTTEDAIQLMKALQVRLRGARRKVRGLKVPDPLRNRLEQTLIEGELTLSQMEKMFGLSISYISRIKRKLRDEGKLNPNDPPILNAYEDHPLKKIPPGGSQAAA